ncbi:MAG: branched-chain amino acid ABC transporter permease [bacterium]
MSARTAGKRRAGVKIVALRVAALHIAVVVALFALQFALPEYHRLGVTRIMILAVFAIGYNILFGYTGLLSLGHAMFFGAGLYAAGLTAYHLGWSVPLAFAAGVGAVALLGLAVGCVALRTTGVSFMIVTLMFSQVAYLATLYFTEYTRGDEGLVLPAAARGFNALGARIDLTDPTTRYNIALALLALAIALAYALARSGIGRAMVAIRENEPRARMLGYNTFAIKLQALVVSAALSSAAGAAYALLFAYLGSSFAAIQYSIDALLYTLLGGAGTVLGPVVGAFLMFYLVDVASQYTSAHLLVVGVALVLLVLYFPRGILGTIKHRRAPWLP